MLSVEHASSKGRGGGSSCDGGEEGGGGGGGREQHASCLVAKQVVEFPQVLASEDKFRHTCRIQYIAYVNTPSFAL